MKKMLYGTLLVVGVFASYQMEARSKRAVEEESSAAIPSEQIGLQQRLMNVQKMLKGKKSSPKEALEIKSNARGIESLINSPHRTIEEANDSLRLSAKGLSSQKLSARRIEVLDAKIDKLEETVKNMGRNS
jgi:predicted acetyltransferase